MTKIILVRHGETVWNLEMKYQGHSDIALTEKGVLQAQKAAQSLKSKKIAAVYASDLSRAVHTATAIAGPHELPVTSIKALREIHFGDWEGLTYDSINASWSNTMNDLYTNPDKIRIPGGETFNEVQERSVEALKQLVLAHPKETIVVVSHGGTIRALLCAALTIPLNHLWNIQQDNTAINILEYYKERTIVSLVNDTCHLKVDDE